MQLLSIQSGVCSMEVFNNRNLANKLFILLSASFFFLILGPSIYLIEGVFLIGGPPNRGFTEAVQQPLRIIDGLDQFIT